MKISVLKKEDISTEYSYIGRGKGRGRPRQDKPCIDLGTPELRHKKTQILQSLQSKSYGEIALTSSALGVLYLRGQISKRSLDAGILYVELAYRIPHILGLSLAQRRSPLVHLGMPRNPFIPLTSEFSSQEAYERRVFHMWRKLHQLFDKRASFCVAVARRVILENQLSEDLLRKSDPPSKELQRLQSTLEVIEDFLMRGKT